MARTTYRVAGMSCDHCVRAVTEELARIAGVTHVDVTLQDGAVTVTTGGPVDDAAVTAAVEAAGYEVVT